MKDYPFKQLTEFMKTATDKQKDIIHKIQHTFENTDVYETPKEVCNMIVNNERLDYIEVFTNSGNLVTSIDITNFEYIHTPYMPLASLTNDLDQLTQALYKNQQPMID